MNDQEMIKTMEHYYGIPADMCNVFMRAAWQASWKASRQGMVIELPNRMDGKYCRVSGFDELAFSCDVQKSIEAAGVRVKV